MPEESLVEDHQANGDIENAIREIGKALFVVEAGPAGLTALRKAGGLERQNRRTRKWERVPEEDLAAGIDTGLVYRVGDVHLRFG